MMKYVSVWARPIPGFHDRDPPGCPRPGLPDRGPRDLAEMTRSTVYLAETLEDLVEARPKP